MQEQNENRTAAAAATNRHKQQHHENNDNNSISNFAKKSCRGSQSDDNRMKKEIPEFKISKKLDITETRKEGKTQTTHKTI